MLSFSANILTFLCDFAYKKLFCHSAKKISDLFREARRIYSGVCDDRVRVCVGVSDDELKQAEFLFRGHDHILLERFLRPHSISDERTMIGGIFLYTFRLFPRVF